MSRLNRTVGCNWLPHSGWLWKGQVVVYMSKIFCPTQSTDFTKEKREAQRVQFPVSQNSWRAHLCPFSFRIFLHCWYLFFIKLPNSQIYLYFSIILILFSTFYVYHHSGLPSPTYSVKAIEIYPWHLISSDLKVSII